MTPDQRAAIRFRAVSPWQSENLLREDVLDLLAALETAERERDALQALLARHCHELRSLEHATWEDAEITAGRGSGWIDAGLVVRRTSRLAREMEAVLGAALEAALGEGSGP